MFKVQEEKILKDNIPFCKMVLEKEKMVIRKAVLGRNLNVIFCVSDSGKIWFQDFSATELTKFLNSSYSSAVVEGD